MNIHSILPTSDAEKKAALDEFFAAVHTAARESEAAVAAAKPALERIAAAITGRDNSQALRVRNLLCSLYAGGSARADVSDLLTLDWSLRKDLCTVFLAFNHGEFSYAALIAAFERVGDHGARWFLGTTHVPRERLREALVFAKAGPLATTPRTSSERGVAEFLASLFTGRPVDLQCASQSLDEQRRALVIELFADYLLRNYILRI